MTMPTPDVEVQVHHDHEISNVDREYARQKVLHVAQRARLPILFAKVDLNEEPNRSQPDRATAKAVLDINGAPIRAHASAATMREAVDLLENRLLHRLEQLSRH